MAVISSLVAKIRAPEPVVDNSDQPADEEKKGFDGSAPVQSPPPYQTDAEYDSDKVDEDVQHGVQAAQATAKVWTKSSMITAYVMIWVITFVDTMQQGMANSLLPYVTSSFQQHSLTAAVSIMSSLIGGLWKLPLAKILDIWGRPQGFFLMVVCLTLGLIMMAACNNVQTYAAAQVFYWVGYNGMTTSISIFIADTSALKNRAFMFAFVSSPYIATVWVGGPLAKRFLASPGGWRWGFGAFAIVTPIVTAPLGGLFYWNYRKAKKMGVMPVRQSNRTILQSLKYYFIEFDIPGLLLISSGLALFLLAFSLYSYQADGWKSALVISFIVIGGCLVIAFALYEKYLAPVTFIPYELLMDRTMIGSCVLAGTVFVSYYIWNSYFLSFLQVVNNLSVTEASYVGNIYSIGSCFWSLIVGALIRYTGRFKWIALYFGVPLTILGVGLMIEFRQPNVHIGYIVMCQIFIAFAGGAVVITEQMAAMAIATHGQVAVVLAVQGMFSSIGGAIGGTVSAAIWTGVFPVKLAEYLPADALPNLDKIYGKLDVQLEYEWGSPARNAIMRAYGDAQKNMLIAATAILSIGLVATAVWRDIKVKDFKQVKGNVI